MPHSRHPTGSDQDAPDSEVTPAPPADNDPLTDQQRAYLTLLFNKYRGALYRYLKGMVHSNEDVAELVQETYFRIMRHTETLRFDAIARSYLFNTATNVAREYYRRRSRRHANQHVDLGEAESLPDEIAPETHAVWEDALRRLKLEVKGLPLSYEKCSGPPPLSTSNACRDRTPAGNQCPHRRAQDGPRDPAVDIANARHPMTPLDPQTPRARDIPPNPSPHSLPGDDRAADADRA